MYGVTRTNGKDYFYDLYGNVIKRGTEVNTYNVYNKPTSLNGVRFDYGPDDETFRQVNGAITTWYLADGSYEVEQNGSVITEKTYVGNYLQIKSGSTLKHRYLLRDHLGSTDVITNEIGAEVARMRFDAYGNRTLSNGKIGDPTNKTQGVYDTQQGYTGHTMVDNLGLVHMQGRVYDPSAGRFLSADIFGRKQLDVIRKRGRWVAYYSNENGLRRIAEDIVIPADLEVGELEEYIADIFHEWAAPDCGAVIRIL